MYNESQVFKVVEGNTRPILYVYIYQPDPLYPDDRSKDTLVDLSAAAKSVKARYRERSALPVNTNITLWEATLVKEASTGLASFTPDSTHAWLPTGITTDVPEFEMEITYSDTAATQTERLVQLLVFSVRRAFPSVGP